MSAPDLGEPAAKDHGNGRPIEPGFWKPSLLGRIFTGSPAWSLALDGEKFQLSTSAELQQLVLISDQAIQVKRGLFWSRILVSTTAGSVSVFGGLPKSLAAHLSAKIDAVQSELRTRGDVSRVRQEHKLVRDWIVLNEATALRASEKCRWITREEQDALLRARPSVDSTKLRSLVKRADVRERLGDEVVGIMDDLNQLDVDWPGLWARLNEDHVVRELDACSTLFQTVESKPLTEEQARAVITFDNRVLVVAAAGSGKTSTMVAKAAYAIHRGLASPKRIVMMAFNKKAATELEERAGVAFERLGMNGAKVEASTFHALGLRIIGKATGRKPDVPEWAVDAVAGFRKLSEIVDQLKDESSSFRSNWDVFRLIYARDLEPKGRTPKPDVWGPNGEESIVTLRGERVRSREEAMIANFLFYNGVEYAYERSYEFDTTTPEHRQYRPDFFYPDIELYHEHFALDEFGRPPPEFGDYLQGVEWKRRLHRQRGTQLIETTSHELRNSDWMERLSGILTSKGITLDPNPDRPIPDQGLKPMESSELIGLVRTFISHAKSNSLSFEDMEVRLDAMSEDAFKGRFRMFLGLAASVMRAWDATLEAEGGIDFEDMLNDAASHVEQGRFESPYDVVMADEFQDASRARARLCRALVSKPGSYFFAVGDDWQSINRFAGADVSVMTGFSKWFGPSQVLKLEQTFRCPQELCDVASRFVSKNPAQIAKRVHSLTPTCGPVLRAFELGHRDKTLSGVGSFLDELDQGLQDGSIPPGRNGMTSVMLLGRYNADRSALPPVGRYKSRMKIEFLTVHRSKGAEADYVVLPALTSRLRGNSFPNTRTDDPVLSLAMPGGDDYPHGEERRLLYVALTRARRGVILFTVKGERSSFLRELIEEHGLAITDMNGNSIASTSCPACKQGVIVTRSGPYGEFQSCSSFPFCEFKPNRGLKGAGACPSPYRSRGSSSAFRGSSRASTASRS